MMRSSQLPTLGALLLIAGVVLIGVSFNITTTTTSVSSSLEISNIHNIGLLQEQMVFLHLGIGLSIVGAIFSGFGMAISSITSALGHQGSDPASKPQAVRSEAPMLSEEELDSRRRKKAAIAVIVFIVVVTGAVILISEQMS